jgi:tryptophan halogenase
VMQRQFESLRDFLVLHYCVARGDDGPFWRERRAAPIPESLREQIALFEASGRLSMRDRESFAEASWVSIYFGHHIWPRRYDPMADMIDVGQLRAVLAQRRDAVAGAAQALPDHMAFIHAHCRAQDR